MALNGTPWVLSRPLDVERLMSPPQDRDENLPLHALPESGVL